MIAFLASLLLNYSKQYFMIVKKYIDKFLNEAGIQEMLKNRYSTNVRNKCEVENVTPNHILVTIARMYYENGMTQQEIADQLGLSRYKVLAMLKETREKGIVSIIVHDPDERCEDLDPPCNQDHYG